jgi:ribose-phosphate pyrophosphokinase
MTTDYGDLKVFSGRNSKALAQRVCDHLKIPLGGARTTLFPDGEIFVKLEDDVRGRDCFVVQSTCEPVNDNLMELLVFIDCLRRASAEAHHRGDPLLRLRPPGPQGRGPRADHGEARRQPHHHRRADRVLCMDLHAAQIQGFFDIPVDHLSRVAGLSATTSARLREGVRRPVIVVSPDVGNVKVAKDVRQRAGAPTWPSSTSAGSRARR